MSARSIGKLVVASLGLCLLQASAAVVTETYTYNFAFPEAGDIDDFQDPPEIFLQTITNSKILYLTKVETRLKLVGNPSGSGFASEMFVSLNRNFEQSAVLLNRVGVTPDNSLGFYHDGWDVTFADNAADDVHFADTADGTGVLIGTFQPDARTLPNDTDRPQLLAAFNNLRGNGDWRLAVGDLELGGVMRLESWTLVLTGESAPEIQVEQPAGAILSDGESTISFGDVAHGTSSSAKTFKITNVGTEDLTGIAVTKEGSASAEFSVNASSLSATLTPGSSTTFTVTFAPNGTGSRGTNLRIASNDADENPFDIVLSGNSTNQNPAANTDTIERFPTGSVKVPVSTLLANDTDPDGDTPLSVTSVGAAASNQATVTLSNGYVFYQPDSGNTAPDVFSYQLADSLGGTATGTVNVNIKVDSGPSQNITSMVMEDAPGGGKQVRISFAGIPGRTYRVQRTDSLTPPVIWETFATVTADQLGAFTAIDPPPLPALRFYRTANP